MQPPASIQGSLDVPPHLLTVEDMATWLNRHTQQLCDLTMPRVGKRLTRSVFWWSEDLARLRHDSVRCSGRFTRACKRGANADEIAELYESRKQARRAYKLAIRKAKAVAWDQMLDTVNGDPWGKPYLIVMGRMRPAFPPICETLEPDFLERVLATLFPGHPIVQCHEEVAAITASDEPPEISSIEFGQALKRLRGRVKAPGPDGITSKV